MSVTTAIILDKRRMNKETKNYPACIRVTFERKPRAFPTGIEMTEAEFDKLASPRLGEKLREIKEKLEKEEKRAKAIIQNFNKFSFSAFSQQFNAFRHGQRRRQSGKATRAIEAGQKSATEQPTAPTASYRENFVNQFGGRKYPREKSKIDYKSLGEVAVYYGIYIEKLEAKDQAGTVSCYVSSIMNLLKYQPQLRFSDVTDIWLHKYEKYMLSQGRSTTTISVYLRCLRRIFNMVKAKRIIDGDIYPFGRDLYVIPAARKRKKALKMQTYRLCLNTRQTTIYAACARIFGSSCTLPTV